MTVSIVMLVVIIGAFLVAVRRLVPRAGLPLPGHVPVRGRPRLAPRRPGGGRRAGLGRARAAHLGPGSGRARVGRRPSARRRSWNSRRTRPSRRCRSSGSRPTFRPRPGTARPRPATRPGPGAGKSPGPRSPAGQPPSAGSAGGMCRSGDRTPVIGSRCQPSGGGKVRPSTTGAFGSGIVGIQPMPGGVAGSPPPKSMWAGSEPSAVPGTSMSTLCGWPSKSNVKVAPTSGSRQMVGPDAVVVAVEVVAHG